MDGIIVIDIGQRLLQAPPSEDQRADQRRVEGDLDEADESALRAPCLKCVRTA